MYHADLMSLPLGLNECLLSSLKGVLETLYLEKQHLLAQLDTL